MRPDEIIYFADKLARLNLHENEIERLRISVSRHEWMELDKHLQQFATVAGAATVTRSPTRQIELRGIPVVIR